jgi:shikimate dehydrogenase
MGDFYAVLGNPISHSKSPQIHHLFAQQTQQQLTYTAIHVELNNLAKTLKNFQTRGGKGVNITLPFKQEAFLLVDSLSERAQQSQAINTIIFNNNNQRMGDNTDGIGLLRDLTLRHQIDIQGKHILILGAGGAVRGILGVLLAAKPALITIANRTESKASQLATEFSQWGPMQACLLAHLKQHSYDLVINATSASFENSSIAFDPSILKNTFCYDMVYSQTTPFLQQAKAQGTHTCCNGLGMLIEQAAEAFYLWRGIRPDTDAVYDLLR